MCIYIYILYLYRIGMYVYVVAAQKHRVCHRPGRPCCNRIGESCDKPSSDKPTEGCRTPTQRPAAKVCNRGPVTSL